MKRVRFHTPHTLCWNLPSPLKLSRICMERAYGSTMFILPWALQRSMIGFKFILQHKQEQFIQTTSISGK